MRYADEKAVLANSKKGLQHNNKVAREFAIKINFYLFIWFDAVTAYKQIMPGPTTALTGMQEIQ